MRLVKGGVSFELPAGLTSIEGLGTDFRTKQEDRAGTHGAVEIGDGKASKKIISLDVHIIGESITDHDNQYDSLMAALSRQDQQLFIRDDRFINLSRLDKVTRKDLKGFQFIRSQVTAALIAADPFWYSTSAVAQETAVTESSTTLTITNQGNIDAPLIVRVAAQADCSSVTVTNATDNDRSFSLSDVLLVSGQYTTVNAEVGTVYRGANNAINTFSGSFLNLLPGENTITYSGGNCVLTITYTPRWL